MAITLGHFARALVSDHIRKMENWALTRPMSVAEYEIAKKFLIEGRSSKKQTFLSNFSTWRGLSVSDFIVLQLLRQGRVSGETVRLLKREFDRVDKDETGLLTLEEVASHFLRH